MGPFHRVIREEDPYQLAADPPTSRGLLHALCKKPEKLLIFSCRNIL
jgi:hypothetical protein